MAPEFIDIEKVCRLCLREDDGRCKMTSMYQQPELDYLIQKCVQIEVSVQLVFLLALILGQAYKWLLYYISEKFVAD